MRDNYAAKPTHMILQGRLAIPLPSPESIHWYLTSLPTSLRMSAISSPCVIDTPDSLDGIVIIAESHISVHVVKASQVLFADVFSCKVYDHRLVYNELVAQFQFVSPPSYRMITRFVPT